MPTPQTILTALQLTTPVLPTGTTTLSIDSSILPIIALSDTSTTRVEVGIYNQVTAISTYTLVGTQNEFSASIPIIPTVAETSVQILGRNYDPTATWSPLTSYASGYRYADPNGHVQVVVTGEDSVSGTSGSIQPAWTTTLPVSISAISITNNTLTVMGANTLSPGQKVYLNGLTNASFLNEEVVTVITVTPSVYPNNSQFTATFAHADYALNSDTGTAYAITQDASVTWANYGVIAITPTIKFNLLFFQSNLATAIAPPSGLTAKNGQNSCTLQWVTPDYPGFIGVRVQVSTDSAGINPPYTQYGDLVTTISSTSSAVIDSTSTTQVNIPTTLITNIEILNNQLTITSANNFVPGTTVSLSGISNADFLNGEIITLTTATSTQFTAAFAHADYASAPDSGTATSIISTNTTTAVQTVIATNYSTVNIPAVYINSPEFYAMFSTVIQDPTTSIVYESVENGPLNCGFVNLQLVSPVDFPVLQRKEDIAGRLIMQITRQRPNLDLSPRSEIRDLFIDPFSIEVSNMSVREWFARVSTSISAISQVDDSTGSGVSTPFQASTYKQQIARAYGLSPTDVQNLIDEQFNILGEQAGLTRLTATPSTVVLTFYTYQQPQTSITVPQGAVVATASDSNTASVQFTTTGQGVINLANLSSFYDPQYGWWSIAVPAQANSDGSVTNVGAGTIRQISSGVPSGLNVTNLIGAAYGTDDESNSSFAARIQARNVTGVDTGTRHGYLGTALATPGIIGAQVVAAGDLEMLRDWDPIRQKHCFGTVDIYTRGTTLSEEDTIVFFQYASTGTYGSTITYLPLTFSNGNTFNITNFSGLTYPLYSAVELPVTRGSSTFYLSTSRAQINAANGTLVINPNDMAYQYVGSPITKAKVPLVLNGTPATNAAALQSLTGSTSGTYAYALYARYKSPFILTPSLQPVLDIFSVTGQADETGTVNDNAITLIHTSDFLLEGGSNDAGDEAQVSIISQATQATITAQAPGTPVQIATAMDVPLDPNGVPIDVLSVRSTDLSTLYIAKKDYLIVPMSPYHTYGLQPLSSTVSVTEITISGSVVTATANNEFGVGAQVTMNNFVGSLGVVLNGQVLTIASASSTQFTAILSTGDQAATATNGTATGSAIQNGQQVVVAFNQFLLYERLSYVSGEAQVLNGTVPTTLDNYGFVQNTWIPESYGNTTLTLDGWDGLYGSDGGLDVAGSTGLVGALVPHDMRYIKVTYNNGVADIVKKENIDFTLTVDPVSGAATVARILTGTIPNGGTVSISYFYLEPFTFATQYPAFVEVLANELLTTKHAAADVIVKAMVANPIDITLAVTLNANTSPESVDSTIRTVIDIVLDNAVGTLYQSELISQVQAITGVQSVQVPLIKCAKSDGSYDIGVVIPTGTVWTKLVNDPAFTSTVGTATTQYQYSWITSLPILPDSTLPSGGQTNAVVDFLYGNQVFRRASSVQDFLSNSPSPPHLAANGTPGSFYIIGTNDPYTTTVNSYFTSSGVAPSTYWQKIMLAVPQDVPNPGNLSYLVTYQVFGEGGAKDVTVSSTEYLSPGRITINYLVGN